MGLDRASRMQSALCGDVGLISLFRSVVSTKANLLSVDRYFGKPSFFVWRNTKVSAFISSFRFAYILFVFYVRHISKICNAIVRRVSIDVINLLFWHETVNIKPRQPMRSDLMTIHLNVDSTSLLPSSGRANGLPSRLDAPNKNSSLGAVIKKLAQAIYAKIRFSHDALQKRIGQRPGGASTLFGLRHFNTIGAP